MQLPVKKPLIIITGPTAVGKTSLSLDLVKELGGEVISADSRLFYRGMDIGTAKPTKEEQGFLKHHLIDVADINNTWSLAVFQSEVYRISHLLWAENKVPFLVGGTGQYVRAIIEGWVIPENKSNERMREIINNWGIEIGAKTLHEKLGIIDPDAAQIIEPNNLRRTIRAFEVIFSTGKRFSSQRKKRRVGFQYKIIGLTRDRVELYKRVDDRIEKMFAEGFVDEVKTILKDGYSSELPALSAIGYKEVIAFLKDEMDMPEVIRLMKKRTREYVRRQANWFKKDDHRIKWFDMNSNVSMDVKEFILSLEGWLNG